MTNTESLVSTMLASVPSVSAECRALWAGRHDAPMSLRRTVLDQRQCLRAQLAEAAQLGLSDEQCRLGQVLAVVGAVLVATNGLCTQDYIDQSVVEYAQEL